MFIIQLITGALSTFLHVMFTCIIAVPLITLGVLKYCIPVRWWRKKSSRWLDWLAQTWIQLNIYHQLLLTGTEIHVEGDLDLRRDEWYLMVCNHQSWVDILVLLRVFNKRIPYVKFFLKKSLIWMPLVGLSCWALDFPFMRRYSAEEIARNPSLKGRDLQETREACEKYRDNPVTIINFLEGSRFTAKKHEQQQSPYQHLLIPKAGGVAFTLAAMNGQLHSLLDVTIYYPDGCPSYWEYASGKVKSVKVHVRQVPISPELIGDYVNDEEFRTKFLQWLTSLWQQKDKRMQMLSQTNKA